MINFGIIGLGRLGYAHACNLSSKIAGASLKAICSLDDSMNEKFLKEVSSDVEVFKDYDEMINCGKIDAVLICSPSSFHAQQIISALDKGLHVFCEKPIALYEEELVLLEDLDKKYPNLKIMVGFQRRFDSAYIDAKKRIDSGEIGDVTLIRSYSIDPSNGIDSFLNFASNSYSGGLFLDMAIHDIDLVQWLSDSKVDKAWAIGSNDGIKAFDEIKDSATGCAMMQLSSGAMALLVAGRNASHGYHIETEIIGTKGTIKIETGLGTNGVVVYNSSGIVRSVDQNFLERFKDAYLNELDYFVSCIENDTKVSISIDSSIYASKVGYALKKSYELNDLVTILK